MVHSISESKSNSMRLQLAHAGVERLPIILSSLMGMLLGTA